MNNSNSRPSAKGQDEPIAEQLAKLNWEREPERDLWPDIAAKLRPQDSDRSPRHQPNWPPFAVAASVAVATVSLLFFSFVVMTPRDLANGDNAMTLYQQAHLGLIEEQHQMVRAQFVALLQHDGRSLNPEFINEIQQVMNTIDSASTEIIAAMKTQPNNPDYSSMLVDTYQHELQLLNRVKSRRGLSI